MLYSTVNAQQANLFPENASQNDTILFAQNVILQIWDPLAMLTFLWLCNHRSIYTDITVYHSCIHSQAKAPDCGKQPHLCYITAIAIYFNV